MNRKKIPTAIETQILTQSRRRCCICYALERDVKIKKGQIAHLNKNRDDNRLDNLVFLCLPHHDQYDSTTSQSKNLTKNEIREFRKELSSQISEIWKKPLEIDKNNHSDLARMISGKYIKEVYNEESELEIMYLGNKRIKVSGISLWGLGNKYGANIGELNFEGDLIGNKIVFSDKNIEKLYRIFLEFNGNEIIATEEYPFGYFGYFGMNVTFDGLYEKIK